jgi:hypothetical protein
MITQNKDMFFASLSQEIERLKLDGPSSKATLWYRRNDPKNKLRPEE